MQFSTSQKQSTSNKLGSTLKQGSLDINDDSGAKSSDGSSIQLKVDTLKKLRKQDALGNTGQLSVDDEDLDNELSDFNVCQKLLKCDKLLSTFNPSMQVETFADESDNSGSGRHDHDVAF